MKRIQYRKFLGILLFSMILSFSLFFFFSKKETFSENENRYLEKFPEFSFSSFQDGSYRKNWETYLSDHFPFRNFFMNIKNRTDLALGKEKIGDIYYGSDGYLIQEYQSPKNTDRIIKVLNQFYADMNYANMSLMLVPTSITINSDKLPKYAPTYSQSDTIKTIYDQIKFDTVDVEETLRKGNQDYQMFYRLDHHWTSYGAYYAYLEFCKANDIVPLDITEFHIEEVSNDFKGTLYSKVIDDKLKPDKIHTFSTNHSNYEVNYVMSKKVTDSLYESSYLKKKDKYSYFLDNNHPLIVITNKDVHNGKELLVLKDSYANSMIPFLINHYEKIHVIDPRFYKLSIKEYMQENNRIKDVFILYNMNTIDNDLGILTIN